MIVRHILCSIPTIKHSEEVAQQIKWLAQMETQKGGKQEPEEADKSKRKEVNMEKDRQEGKKKQFC